MHNNHSAGGKEGGGGSHHQQQHHNHQQQQSRQGGGGGGPGGGGPGGPGMDAGQRLLASILGLTALGLLLSGEPGGKEISWQEFVTQMLESGEVERIIVSNKNVAKVVLRRPDSPLGGHRAHGGVGHGMDGSSGPDQWRGACVGWIMCGPLHAPWPRHTVSC